MPEAVNGARYACQKCMNGHRTKTCQHWENEHDKLARSIDIEKVAPGVSRENIAVFAKTRNAGRPKAADLEKEKKGTTLYLLLKTTVDGKETCKAIGEIDIDADGNQKETRKMCCSSNSTPSPSNHNRSKSGSSVPTSSKKRPLEDMKIGDVSYETTRKNPKHECKCGSGCGCSFCPQHPNNKATQEAMRKVVGQVQQEVLLHPKQHGQIQIQQDLPSIVSCGGGHITGANSQIYATDDVSVFNTWREEADNTGNYMTTVPFDWSSSFPFDNDRSTGSPASIQSPQKLHFNGIESPMSMGLHNGSSDRSAITSVDDLQLPSPIQSQNHSLELFTPLDGWVNGAIQQQNVPDVGFQGLPPQMVNGYYHQQPLVYNTVNHTPSTPTSLPQSSCCSKGVDTNVYPNQQPLQENMSFRSPPAMFPAETQFGFTQPTAGPTVEPSMFSGLSITQQVPPLHGQTQSAQMLSSSTQYGLQNNLQIRQPGHRHMDSQLSNLPGHLKASRALVESSHIPTSMIRRHTASMDSVIRHPNTTRATTPYSASTTPFMTPATYETDTSSLAHTSPAMPDGLDPSMMFWPQQMVSPTASGQIPFPV